MKKRNIILETPMFVENTESNIHKREILNLRLRTAIINNNYWEIEELLEQGAYIDTASDYGIKALISAAKRGEFKLVKTLLESDINLKNANNFRLINIFITLSGKRHFKWIKILLDAGVNINVQDDNGTTALMSAVYTGNYKLTKIFLDAGVEVNVQSDKGKTALMFAALSEYRLHSEHIIPALLTTGANVNIRDDDGKTALIHAAESGHESWHNGKNTLEETIKTLLTTGADANVKDKNAKTALMYAIENKRDNEIIKLFEQYEKYKNKM